jgi:hypothetical protein
MADLNRELDALVARVARWKLGAPRRRPHRCGEARPDTLDDRVERFSQLELWARVAIVTATIVGVSVSGGILLPTTSRALERRS